MFLPFKIQNINIYLNYTLLDNLFELQYDKIHYIIKYL